MQRIYESVLIPHAVYEELLDERAGETVIVTVQSATWLKVRSVQARQLADEFLSICSFCGKLLAYWQWIVMHLEAARSRASNSSNWRLVRHFIAYLRQHQVLL